MDKDSDTECLVAPTTPSRNSNRHELLWENLPDCTPSHWEEIGRTPIVMARPRNYSKTVNLSDRRRSLSEGQDWFDEFDNSDLNEVFEREKFVPLRDSSSQVSEVRQREEPLPQGDEEVASNRKTLGRGRRGSVGPRLLSSRDFNTSNDDVFQGPVFFMDPGSRRRALSSRSISVHNSSYGGNPDIADELWVKKSSTRSSMDLNKAAKQLKYYEPVRRGRCQRVLLGKENPSAGKEVFKTMNHERRCSTMKWPVFEVVQTQERHSEVDGGKLAKGVGLSKESVPEIDHPGQTFRNPIEFPASDEDSPETEELASSQNSDDLYLDKKFTSREDPTSRGDMNAWNLCFDPTPMKSENPRVCAVEEPRESFQSVSHDSESHSTGQLRPGTSRKKWDKITKNKELRKCRDEDLASITYRNGFHDSHGNDYVARTDKLARKKYTGRSHRYVNDQCTRKKRENGGIPRAFNRTCRPCDLKEMSRVYHPGCRRKGDHSTDSKHCDSMRGDCTCLCNGNIEVPCPERFSRSKDRGLSNRYTRIHESGCRVREDTCRKHHDRRPKGEIHRDTLGCNKHLWQDFPCRHGICPHPCCPISALLPILSQGCCQRVYSDCHCNMQTCACSEFKLGKCSRHGTCISRKNSRYSSVHSSDVFENDIDAGQDQLDGEVEGVDYIDGKTYLVNGDTQNRKIQRGGSLGSFRRQAEPPVLLSYRQSVDSASDVLGIEQKSDVSSQTEPNASNCATQAKPGVRHSVTQYSSKVNNCNKDTQCITHTASVCTQAVIFEPQDHGTQFPERRESHHKQTQCNFATGRKSVQANLKRRSYPLCYNYGTGTRTNYRRREDYYYADDCSFRSSQSSFRMSPDAQSNLTIVATKNAPTSAVAAVAAASVTADNQALLRSNEELYQESERKVEPPAVTLRCLVSAVKQADNNPKVNSFVKEVTTRNGEDCVDGGRQRTLSQRSSSLGNPAIATCSRSRGKSVSFPSDIAMFFDYNNSPRQVLSSENSDDSLEIRAHSLQCCDH